MIDLKRPIADIVADVRSGALSAVELVTASLEAIEENQEYHAILEINEQALARAKDIDAGNKSGRLAGIPFIAKDNFLTHHTHTTASSNMLKPFKAPYQSTVIERLEAEGAIMVAKANLDAFAHGSSTENSDFGPTKNPVDPTRVPGGSSGGSAAAVALGLACFALGTDTGGSIRQPAAFCGVVGYKPTYGLVSRYGVVAMGSSVDVIGPLANRTADAALILDVMAAKDSADATTIDRSESGYETKNPAHLTGKKIGLITEYLGEGIEPAVKEATLAAVAQLKKAGAIVEEVSLPSTDLALACYYILIPAELSSNLARYDGIRFGHSSNNAQTLADTYLMSRDEGFGAEAKRPFIISIIESTRKHVRSNHNPAQKVRTLLIREFDEAFKKYDFLLGPTAPTTAFKLGEKNQDPLAMYLSDVDTVAVNMVGAPAISIPSPTDGMPIGIQLMAPQRKDRELLAAALTLEGVLA